MLGKFFHFFIKNFFATALVFFAVWIGHAALKEIDRGSRIQSEIAFLEAEAQKTRKENAVLRGKIDYFKTDSFQEQEAKAKLNYQNSDEKVVVIKQEITHDDHHNTDHTPVFLKEKDLEPHYKKWWTQFFGA